MIRPRRINQVVQERAPLANRNRYYVFMDRIQDSSPTVTVSHLTLEELNVSELSVSFLNQIAFGLHILWGT